MRDIVPNTAASTQADLRRYSDYFEGLFRTNFFKCFNDETRQKIILLVGQYGEEGVRVAEIAEYFELDRTTVSHHLAMLRDCKLLTMTKHGKERYYSMNSDYIIGVLEQITSVFKSCCNEAFGTSSCDSDGD